MDSGIEIRLIMNSDVEDVLSFKTCCGLKAFDQNLEIHVRNRSALPVTIRGYFDLSGRFGKKRISHLLPGGDLTLEPGELKAFYCTMEETVWAQAFSAEFFDDAGRCYEIPVHDRANGNPP